MDDLRIRFDDGAAYEEHMGKWSLLAGELFLQWLAPPAGLRWVDVGCGNGAFTELLLQRCAPADVQGVDPSEAQLAYARGRFTSGPVQFQLGDAMALPFADGTFDAAVMALVIFFVPDPTRGVAEMCRVVKPGGRISAYAWDILGGGFPFAPLQEEMAACGTPPLLPPSVEAARMDNLQALWRDAGLVDIATQEISVQRNFADFDAWWASASKSPRMSAGLAAMAAEQVALLKDRLRVRLGGAGGSPISYRARANAIQGSRPA